MEGGEEVLEAREALAALHAHQMAAYVRRVAAARHETHLLELEVHLAHLRQQRA